MASPNNPMRECLRDLDVKRARVIWAKAFKHLPQPRNDAEMLIMLHSARTQADSMTLKDRAWSHKWLLDNGIPSSLPDHLKPKAERFYPKIVTAVGVSVKSLSEAGAALAAAQEKAMSDAVAECYADGQTDPEFVKARMEEARRKVLAS